MQKKIIRIKMGCRSTDSCRKLFLNLDILPLRFQYILSLLLFMIRNKNQFQVNSEIHQINTRQHANLHQPSANATKYQKGVHCIGVKVYNMVPFYIKAQIDNPKKFRAVWHKYLRENLFLFPEWIFWTPQLKSDMQFKLTHEGFGTHVPSL